jgi:hypothetical protein
METSNQVARLPKTKTIYIVALVSITMVLKSHYGLKKTQRQNCFFYKSFASTITD